MENEKSISRKKTIVGRDLSQLGRKRPADLELEQAVLGALLLERDALTEVIEILSPETFDKEAHQVIYKAIRMLFSKSEPVDLLTVTNQLRSTGELEAAGGILYITQLTNRVNSAANIVYHSRLLLQYAIKRELIRISTEIQRDSYEETTDVFELLDKTEQSLFEVSEMNIRKNYSSMQNILHETLAEMELLRKNKDGLTGVPSGYTKLDRITSGWQKSDLLILAARPGMGKTAFVLNILRNASVEFSKAVAIFSLEMSEKQLAQRLVASEAEVDGERIRSGKLTDLEWAQIIDKTARLSQSPIFIDDTPALSILELRAKCRRLKAQHDIQMVVIDYLQLMRGDTSKGNREQEIASISRSLKQIAKELNIPVMALSQLSRAVETRGGDKRPQLSDLRESGSIEQDADMVMFLYRPDYYGITEDESGNSSKGLVEVIIAKNRHGGLEDVPLRFIHQFAKFTDWEEQFMAEKTSFPQNSVSNSSPTTSIKVSSSMNNNLGGASSIMPSGNRPPFDEDPPF
jgi:replicative DNA helicase